MDGNLQGNPIKVPVGDHPIGAGAGRDGVDKNAPGVDLAAQGDPDGSAGHGGAAGPSAASGAAVEPPPPSAEDTAMLSGDVANPGDDDPARGISRVNKKGLLIFFVFVGLIVCFVAYELVRKSRRQDAAYALTGDVIDSSQRARAIAGGAGYGQTPLPGIQVPTAAVVPEAKPAEPEKKPVPPSRPQPVQQRPVQRVNMRTEKAVGPDPVTAERLRLEAMRQKMFEEAIGGEVRFDVTAGGVRIEENRNPWTPPPSGGGRMGLIAEIDNELDRVNAIAADDTDLNAAYQRRAAIPAVGVGQGPAPAAAPMVGGMGGQAVAAPVRGGAVSMAERGKNLEDFDGDSARWVLSSEVENPSQYMLRAGGVIPAVLLSGINSDLPGQIMAQVSQNVYDTPTGRYLLIPQGTRLIGGYSSDVQYGADRVFVAWQRLVFPDGRAYDIGSQPGTTGAGYAGLRDRVNHHFVRVFGSALMMSAIIGGIAYNQERGSSSGNNNNNNNNNNPRMSDAMSEALGQQLGQVTAQMIAKNLNIAPTIEIRPGFRLNVMLVRDLTFKDRYRAFNYRYAE